MPHPDPNGLSIYEREDGTLGITAEIWWHGNRRHRIARMRAVARNIACDGWRCRWCGTEIALFKRSDARYCGERCRKVVARRRRAERLVHQKPLSRHSLRPRPPSPQPPPE